MEFKSTFAIVAVLVLSLGLISAAITGVNTSIITDLPDPVTPGDSHNITVNVNNSFGENLTIEWLNSTSTSGTIWTFLPLNSTLTNNSNENYTATLSIPIDFEDDTTRIFKANVFALNGSFLATIQESLTLNFTNTTTTDSEEPLCVKNGTLKIRNFDVSNLGNGKDDEWEPLDDIEIEVEIENTDNDESVSDVLVELFIFDKDGDDVTNDFDITDEEIDLGNIKKDDKETATFEIKEIPGDIEEGDYRIYIKAYSEDDEVGQCVSETSDFDNSEGNDFYEDIEVIREDDPAVVIKDSDLEFNFQASCGDQNVGIGFPVYNIGTDKEDKVLVRLVNTLLGIDELVEINDLKEGRQKDVSFLIDISEDLSSEIYSLNIITYFEYDDGNGLEPASYDSNSEEDLENGDFTAKLEILSCRGPAPSIAADLISEAIVGKELKVSALITNNGDEENEFDFTLSGIEGWAELVSISPGSSTIGNGETIEILITLNPLKDGSQTFKLNIISDGEIYDQSISVNVAESEGFSIWELSDSTKYLASAIAALIFLIIITSIVKVSRKPAKAEF